MNLGISRRRRKDERGAEAVAMIFVIPVLIVLVLALVDVGMMFRSRMLVENITRDAARNAAAEGGNFNPRTNYSGKAWDDSAFQRLYREGKCTVGNCKEGKVPSVDCTFQSTPEGSPLPKSNVVRKAGDIVTCKTYYPYKAINSELLNGPIGLGMGTLLKEFNVDVSARAETGSQSGFGSG
jgi:hypothetical protein